MNLKKRRRNKSTRARVCVSIPTTSAAVTSAPTVTTTAIAPARIAAAVISGMVVPTEPAMAGAVAATFAAGIGTSRTILPRCAVLRCPALAMHEPAKQDCASHDHQRQ